MVHLAMTRTGFAPEQTVLLGDRLYTDIACGVNAGIDTVFVLSGEGTEADIETFGVQPTWVRRDIAELLQELQKRRKIEKISIFILFKPFSRRFRGNRKTWRFMTIPSAGHLCLAT